MSDFQKRPSWSVWLDLVDAEVKGKAPVRDVYRLRQNDNLVPWLRALNYLAAEVDMHIADSRRRLGALKPAPGTHPSDEYLAVKRQHDALHARRIRYRRRVEGRIEECRHLLDESGQSRFTPAGMVESLAKIEELLMRDDIDGALRVTRHALSNVPKDAAA